MMLQIELRNTLVLMVSLHCQLYIGKVGTCRYMYMYVIAVGPDVRFRVQGCVATSFLWGPLD